MDPSLLQVLPRTSLNLSKKIASSSSKTTAQLRALAGNPPRHLASYKKHRKSGLIDLLLPGIQHFFPADKANFFIDPIVEVKTSKSNSCCPWLSRNKRFKFRDQRLPGPEAFIKISENLI